MEVEDVVEVVEVVQHSTLKAHCHHDLMND